MYEDTAKLGDEEQAFQDAASPHHVTVLTTASAGFSLVKTWIRTHKEKPPRCLNYDNPKFFDIQTYTFNDFASLCAFLDELGPKSQTAIVYGDLHPRFNGHAKKV